MSKNMWNDLAELAKALVRPYIICYSWTIIGVMWLNEQEIPPLLLGVATVIVAEYGLERAVKRWRGK